MANVTVTVPKEFKERTSEHQEINWSEVAREAFEQKIIDLETIERIKDFKVIDEIAEGSDLTEKDVAKIAEKINNCLAEPEEVRNNLPESCEIDDSPYTDGECEQR